MTVGRAYKIKLKKLWVLEERQEREEHDLTLPILVYRRCQKEEREETIRSNKWALKMETCVE